MNVMNKVSNKDIMARFAMPRPMAPTRRKVEEEQRQDSTLGDKAKECVSSKNSSDEAASTSSAATATVLSHLAVVRNIPSGAHSSHLRSFFSTFVEEARFRCFHYRHRPEVKTVEADSSKSTCCCVVQFHDDNTRAEFIKEFNTRRWLRPDGLETKQRCFVAPIKIGSSGDSLSASDARELIELRPPAAMPEGNVGTPTDYFLEQIRLCKLPPSLIGKLGLKPRRRRRQFDSVPMAYDNGPGQQCGPAPMFRAPPDPVDAERRRDTLAGQTNRVNSARDKEEPLDATDAVLEREYGPDNDCGGDDDDDQCEEWERHEALHEDVTEQDRAKPRKYEEEMEVTWEKGGPGLVWHTDKNFWDQIEKGTDCDWAWADDWDVDYSVYYEGKSAGSSDARQAVEIREDEQLRSGRLHQSVFTRCGREGQGRKRRRSEGDADAGREVRGGKAEGMMRAMGWAQGGGLGKQGQGRVQPAAVDMLETGQEKRGLGYYGDKMQRTGFEKKRVVHAIGSKFDAVLDTRESGRMSEQGERLLRRHEPTHMKYRE